MVEILKSHNPDQFKVVCQEVIIKIGEDSNTGKGIFESRAYSLPMTSPIDDITARLAALTARANNITPLQPNTSAIPDSLKP